jgi:hypothetical protein
MVRRNDVDLVARSKASHPAMLDRLGALTDAFVKSDLTPHGCLPGTREQLLDDVMDWFAADGPSVYWLRGLAGTGKSTIARSVADLAEQQGLLGASFFFSRTNNTLQSALAVLPTMAYQLARWRPALRQPLCDAIRSNKEIAKRTMKEQVECLFVRALSRITSPVPRALLVVDALDECNKIGDCEGGQLVPLLVGCLGRLPFSLKVFITSRDEPSIRRMFDSLQSQHPLHMAALHADIKGEMVNAAIELHLHDRLCSIPDASKDASLYHNIDSSVININSEHCMDPAYLVDTAHYHQRLADGCLALMNEALRYNICELSEPGTANDKLPDLESVLQGVVPAELRYACMNWAAHLAQATSPKSCLRDELTKFCKEHLLHWFEVMSLISRFSSCDEILAASLTWCKASVNRPRVRRTVN